MTNQSNRKEVKEISAERGKKLAASLESLSFFLSFKFHLIVTIFFHFFTLAERMLRLFSFLAQHR